MRNDSDARAKSHLKISSGPPSSDLLVSARHPRFTLHESLIPGITKPSKDLAKREGSPSIHRIITPMGTIKSQKCSLQIIPLQIEVIDEASLAHVGEEGQMPPVNQPIPLKTLSINSICTENITQSDVSPPNIENLSQS